MSLEDLHFKLKHFLMLEESSEEKLFAFNW